MVPLLLILLVPELLADQGMNVRSVSNASIQNQQK